MNKNLLNVFNWCFANKLSLNPKKSIYILLSPKSNTKLPQISMNDITIYPHIDVKYPGVLVDTRLNFLSHIKSNEQKISRLIGIILKLSSFLPSSALLNLYYFLIHPQLCLPIWGSSYSTYLRNLCTLQNKAVRLINKD